MMIQSYTPGCFRLLLSVYQGSFHELISMCFNHFPFNIIYYIFKTIMINRLPNHPLTNPIIFQVVQPKQKEKNLVKYNSQLINNISGNHFGLPVYSEHQVQTVWLNLLKMILAQASLSLQYLCFCLAKQKQFKSNSLQQCSSQFYIQSLVAVMPVDAFTGEN